MCGIVGYVGGAEAKDILLAGLHRLEYRGYDSAGVSVCNGSGIATVKAAGKLKALDDKVAGVALPGSLGIGHTRWATHGAPTDENAHPHEDAARGISIVHNGIIENYLELRRKLAAQGIEFRSETDTETLAHLIRSHYTGDLYAAVKAALHEVRGAYALGVICSEEPGTIVAARRGAPLLVALGDGEAFIASDAAAVLGHTRRVIYLDDGDIARVTATGTEIETLEGEPRTIEVTEIEWDDAAAEKGGYAHFMLKEIFEQPEVLRNTLRGRVEEGSDAIHLEEMQLSEQELRDCQKIVIVACGTAWHAGLIGKYLIERFARVPVEVDVSSEYRYRDPLVGENTFVIPVTQSGETADTLEAIRIAKDKGAKVVSIVNVVGSTIARESAGVIYTQAGPEIGVASTKAYTSQIMALALFTLYLARVRGTVDPNTLAQMIAHLRAVPDKVQACLDREDLVKAVAADVKYRDPQSAFFMGRGFNYPSALEGALKLKEISYIHAEGYAAGEMKHGPIALITDRVPMIGIATRGAVYEKMVSNLQEIRARSGVVLSIATDGDTEIAKHSDDVLYVPDCYEPFSPMVVAVPLQLLSYHVAVNRDCDVDQPRNLAKSVTVE